MVLLVDVSVRRRELCDGTVEAIARTEIGRDRNAISRSRMCTRQRPPARPRVIRHPLREDRFDVE
jgi:hypothetical protein